MIPIIGYSEWKSEKKFAHLYSRELTFSAEIESSVRAIIEDVRENGDDAVIKYTERFDGIRLDNIEQVEKKELESLHSKANPEFIEALRESIENVREFHSLQLRDYISLEKEGGIKLGLRYSAIASVGLYVPGGAAAYPSSIVMNAVPAQVAGVKRIVVVTPPARFRENPHIAAALVELGITEVYTIGGAQSVAALAYGTKSVKRVDKIVGPGNMYVAVAKRQVFGQVDIDMVAGPSEIVVVADETAEPAFVAADMLSQAEHGSGMETAVLLTTSAELAGNVQKELYEQAKQLSRYSDIVRVLENNAIVLVDNLDLAADAVNIIAPEHLELIVRDTDSLLKKIKNAGAIFIGPYSPEPLSDYYAGPNHVLPTSGTARYASPLGVYDFQKCTSIVDYSKEALEKCAVKVDILARTEGFDAHARAVTIRLGKKG